MKCSHVLTAPLAATMKESYVYWDPQDAVATAQDAITKIVGAGAS